jgi:hypothetical protein
VRDARIQPFDCVRQRGAEVTRFSARDESAPARRVQHQLHAPRWTILLESHHGIHGAAHSKYDLANGLLGPLLHVRRDGGAVRVKDDFHKHQRLRNAECGRKLCAADQTMIEIISGR